MPRLEKRFSIIAISWKIKTSWKKSLMIKEQKNNKKKWNCSKCKKMQCKLIIWIKLIYLGTRTMLLLSNRKIFQLNTTIPFHLKLQIHCHHLSNSLQLQVKPHLKGKPVSIDLINIKTPMVLVTCMQIISYMAPKLLRETCIRYTIEQMWLKIWLKMMTMWKISIIKLDQQTVACLHFLQDTNMGHRVLNNYLHFMHQTHSLHLLLDHQLVQEEQQNNPIFTTRHNIFSIDKSDSWITTRDKKTSICGVKEEILIIRCKINLLTMCQKWNYPLFIKDHLYIAVKDKEIQRVNKVYIETTQGNTFSNLQHKI